jgi:vacuolar-type H+-ATPase subunit E/Vma4
MSLETILGAILADGDARVAEIEHKASVQVNEALAAARTEAEELEEDAANAAVLPAAKERARVLHRARLESMHIVGQACQGLIDAALEETRAVLAGLRGERMYADVLCRLLEEAVAELHATLGDAGRVHLNVDPRDQELLESMLRHMVLDVSVSYKLDSWGGLNAQSEDGRVTVTNHLEARLERALPYLQRYLAAWFEEGQWQTSTTEMPAYTP